MATKFPSTYDEWRRCITVDCGIELNESYVEARLLALRDPSDPYTAEFIKVYGEGYLSQVIAWFERADRDQTAAS